MDRQAYKYYDEHFREYAIDLIGQLIDGKTVPPGDIYSYKHKQRFFSDPWPKKKKRWWKFWLPGMIDCTVEEADKQRNVGMYAPESTTTEV